MTKLPPARLVGKEKFGGESALDQMINLPAAKVSLLKSLLSNIHDDDGSCSSLSLLSKNFGSELVPCAIIEQVEWLTFLPIYKNPIWSCETPSYWFLL
jgi:hypothetical protein